MKRSFVESLPLLLTVLAALLAAGCGAKTQTNRKTGNGTGVWESEAGGSTTDSVSSASHWNNPVSGDYDGDGIPDGSDACPEIPEDRDNFEDEDGCPEPDNDEDKILDAVDSCPNEPETYNGTDDEDGCPDESKIFVHACPKIEIPEVLHYESGDPMIKPGWKAMLDAIADVIITNPMILRVEVAAHTDQKGMSQYNLKMSRERAEAVVSYLVKKGVKKEILSAAGYGEECPMNYGSSEESFAKNKRIEFKLLETTEGCTKIQFTCQKAVDMELVPEEDQKYLPENDYCKN